MSLINSFDGFRVSALSKHEPVAINIPVAGILSVQALTEEVSVKIPGKVSKIQIARDISTYIKDSVTLEYYANQSGFDIFDDSYIKINDELSFYFRDDMIIDFHGYLRKVSFVHSFSIAITKPAVLVSTFANAQLFLSSKLFFSAS